MSKGARLERLRRNLAKKTNNFKDVDKQYKFMIWYAEKEFNVGPITEDFLLMKLLNLFDKENHERYEQMMEEAKQGTSQKTLGK